MDSPNPRTMDAVAAIPSAGWLVLHSNNISLYLQWTVAVVAIISGICAALYHIKAVRRLK